MLNKTVLAAMMAASSLMAFPASASVSATDPDPDDGCSGRGACLPPPDFDPTGSPPPYPEGGVNCAFISTDHSGNGYYVCDYIFMDIVTP